MAFKDLTGMTFGRLTVIKDTKKRKHGSIVWECECQCGNIVEATTDCLSGSKTKSCGCLHKELRPQICKRTFTTHGQTKTKLYWVWQGIKRRCYSKKDKQYKDYGGRGISMTTEWKNDFCAFQKWAIQNGYKKGLTIERIDVNGNYEPNNCTWIPLRKQNMNRRTTHFLTYNEKTMSITEWANETGIPRKTISQRINNYGWSIERALTTKVRNRIK